MPLCMNNTFLGITNELIVFRVKAHGLRLANRDKLETDLYSTKKK